MSGIRQPQNQLGLSHATRPLIGGAPGQFASGRELLQSTQLPVHASPRPGLGAATRSLIGEGPGQVGSGRELLQTAFGTAPSPTAAPVRAAAPANPGAGSFLQAPPPTPFAAGAPTNATASSELVRAANSLGKPGGPQSALELLRMFNQAFPGSR